MKILIAGGTGFIGQRVVDSFKEYNFINISKKERCEQCSNNIILDLSRSILDLNISFSEPIDLVINCVDSNEKKDEKIRRDIVDSTKNLLELAKKNAIPKFIHLSINEAESIKDEYQKAKLLAERAVENSRLQYLILRMSPVFGEGSQLDSLVDAIMSKKRVAQIGASDDKIAPIHYSDIVRNIKKAIEDESKWNNVYSLCGPEYMTFNEYLSRYADKKIKVYKMPKIMERFYLASISDKYTKRVAYSIANSYYQDSKYIHKQIVKPLKFY